MLLIKDSFDLVIYHEKYRFYCKGKGWIMITVYFLKGKSVTSRVFTKNPKRYIIGFRHPKNPNTRKFFFSSLSSPPLPDLSLFFSFLFFFSSFFLFFLSSSFPFLSSGQQLLRRALANQAGTQARHPNAGRPTQARSGPVQVASPEPFRGQLMRELSCSRRPRFVDGFLVCTR